MFVERYLQAVVCVLGCKSAGMWACSRLVLPTRPVKPEGERWGEAGSRVDGAPQELLPPSLVTCWLCITL